MHLHQPILEIMENSSHYEVALWETHDTEDDCTLVVRTEVAQIKGTLETLHHRNIIWGDAKAENILVDLDDNAWIIDFGGSYTPG